jgi:hypothetical protein
MIAPSPTRWGCDLARGVGHLSGRLAENLVRVIGPVSFQTRAEAGCELSIWRAPIRRQEVAGKGEPKRRHVRNLHCHPGWRRAVPMSLI